MSRLNVDDGAYEIQLLWAAQMLDGCLGLGVVSFVIPLFGSIYGVGRRYVGRGKAE
jgi:hypothetical protein